MEEAIFNFKGHLIKIKFTPEEDKISDIINKFNSKLLIDMDINNLDFFYD